MNFLDDELNAWRAADLERQLVHRADEVGRFIKVVEDGRETCLLNFSSNNYLGLASHPALITAAQCSAKSGTGSTASRLVVGNLAEHEALEQELAAWHGLEAARLFGSGYQANVGLLSSIAGAGDLIISDELNHASMIDGCRLSRAQVRVARHGDVGAFEEALQGEFRRRFIVTDSVFSMDGDVAPLRALRELCDRHGAFLIVDEAHALGVLNSGRGACYELGVIPDALVGGMGKAFGSFGGYVAGSAALARFLLNRARSLVFSTALPPAVVGASRAGLQIFSGEEGAGLRKRLAARISQLRTALDARGWLAPGAGDTTIFPLVVGEAQRALELSAGLRERGIHCGAIRPPTVAPGTARLRIALSAAHEAEDIDLLIERLAELRFQAHGP